MDIPQPTVTSGRAGRKSTMTFGGVLGRLMSEEETVDVSLEQLAEDAADGQGFDAMVGADVLQSVPVTLSVEVGRTRLKSVICYASSRAVLLSLSATQGNRLICWSTILWWLKVRLCWSMIVTASD